MVSLKKAGTRFLMAALLLVQSAMKELLFIVMLLVAFGAGVWVQTERCSNTDAACAPGAASTQSPGRTAFEGREGRGIPSPDRSSLPISRKEQDRQKLNQKLASLDAEIATAQDQLQRAQDDLQTSNIDQQIKQQQAALNTLQAQAQSQSAKTQDAAQLQNQAILAEQDNQVLQQQLAGIQQEIQQQQYLANNLALQIQSTSAPDTSDVMVGLNNQLRTVNQRIQQLRANYTATLQAQQRVAASRYTNQADAQSRQQTSEVSNDIALAQSKQTLDSLFQQQQQLNRAVDDSKKRIADLQNQRASVLDELSRQVG